MAGDRRSVAEWRLLSKVRNGSGEIVSTMIGEEENWAVSVISPNGRANRPRHLFYRVIRFTRTQGERSTPCSSSVIYIVDGLRLTVAGGAVRRGIISSPVALISLGRL